MATAHTSTQLSKTQKLCCELVVVRAGLLEKRYMKHRNQNLCSANSSRSNGFYQICLSCFHAKDNNYSWIPVYGRHLFRETTSCHITKLVKNCELRGIRAECHGQISVQLFASNRACCVYYLWYTFEQGEDCMWDLFCNALNVNEMLKAFRTSLDC